jgi:hypothetical protein
MNAFRLFLPVIAVSFVASLHAETPLAFQGTPNPPAGQVAHSLFWIADTRKMDEFLNYFHLEDVHAGSYAGEVLPDTRTAWRDYAIEATVLAQAGRDAEAAAKIGQMLKLAAVYRSFGGLQNVVQGAEISYLAGLTTERLGRNVAVQVRSPYVEKDASDSLITLENQIGAGKNQVTPSFWEALEKCVVDTHYRLALCASPSIAEAH